MLVLALALYAALTTLFTVSVVVIVIEQLHTLTLTPPNFSTASDVAAPPDDIPMGANADNHVVEDDGA